MIRTLLSVLIVLSILSCLHSIFWTKTYHIRFSDYVPESSEFGHAVVPKSTVRPHVTQPLHVNVNDLIRTLLSEMTLCPGVNKKSHPPVTHDWQSVDKTTFVYSAFADPRNVTLTVVRVIAMMLWTDVYATKQPAYFCQLHIKGNRFSVKANIRTYGSERQTEYKGVAFDCVLPINPWIQLNSTISIGTSSCGKVANALKIHQNYMHGHQNDFSVCLAGALKHNISSYHQLIEWVELNKILGAKHFFIYNFTGGAALKSYLDYYARKGIMTVLPFTLPMEMKNKDGTSHSDFRIIWNYGQEILIQDCLQRNLLVARHLVYLDLDEFMIPQQDKTLKWDQMLKDANCSSESGLFVGRNANFPVNIEESVKETPSTTLRLQTLQFNRRHVDIYKVFKRTKYIAIPERMLFVRVHYKDTYWVDGTITCRMPTEAAILHHYRVAENDLMMSDNTISEKYSKELIEGVKQVYNDFNIGLQDGALQ